MTKKKLPDFPYADREFTKPADELINIIVQYWVRIRGEKPDFKTILEAANKVLEERKR